MRTQYLASSTILTLAVLFLGVNARLLGSGNTSKEQFLSLPNYQVRARFVNPNESVWKDATREVYEPRPDLNMVMLKRLPIRDGDGVAVKPVVSILLMPLPDGITTLEEFADYKQKKNPMKVEIRLRRGNKMITQGTIEYGGAVHRIIRVFLVEGNAGLDLICDTYDSVYDHVRDDFNSWIESARLTPR